MESCPQADRNGALDPLEGTAGGSLTPGWRSDETEAPVCVRLTAVCGVAETAKM
jgi:hypothetical protein